MAMKSTTITSPIDIRGDERDLDCTTPTNGMLPPSPMRRAGFTGLLDIIMYQVTSLQVLA
jgi:hypothetical protein